MKIINKNKQKIEVPIDELCISTDGIIAEHECILLNYDKKDLHLLLKDEIFNIARQCGIIFPDLKKTGFKFYISLQENEFNLELFIEIFPVKIQKEEIDECFITTEHYLLSKQFYENPSMYDNYGMLKIELSELEQIRLLYKTLLLTNKL